MGKYDRYDDIIKWKHFPRYRHFVLGIHRSQVNSPHKGQWRGALMLSLICAWTKGWANNQNAGDLRCYCARYDITVMTFCTFQEPHNTAIGNCAVCVTVKSSWWQSVPYDTVISELYKSQDGSDTYIQWRENNSFVGLFNKLFLDIVEDFEDKSLTRWKTIQLLVLQVIIRNLS